MSEIIGVECPYCQRTIEDELETAYILIPRLDAIRFNLLQTQAIISRIESQATMYQPWLRRLCREATYHLAVNIDNIRSTIKEAHHFRPEPKDDSMPAWW